MAVDLTKGTETVFATLFSVLRSWTLCKSVMLMVAKG